MRQARSIAVGVAHTKSRVQNAAAAATATDFFTIESVFLRTIYVAKTRSDHAILEPIDPDPRWQSISLNAR